MYTSETFSHDTSYSFVCLCVHSIFISSVCVVLGTGVLINVKLLMKSWHYMYNCSLTYSKKE